MEKDLLYKEDRLVEVEGIKTNTILDKFYFKTILQENRAVYQSLDGIPKQAILHLVGTNGTGKSLLAANIAANLIQNKKVLYINTEVIGDMIYSKIYERCKILGLEFKRDNLFIIDLVRNNEALYEPDKLLNYLKEKKIIHQIDFVIIDSITAFYEGLENVAKKIVRKIYNFFKVWRKTGIFISQKRSSHEENTSEAAGGYGVAHILDSTIVLVKKIINNKWEAEDYGVSRGKMIRLMRVDDCRICAHISKEILFEITIEGEFKIVKEKER